MSEPVPQTVLCLASYEKGGEFIEECARQGCRVLLLTLDSLRDGAWPVRALDDLISLPALSTRDEVIRTVSRINRDRVIDLIIPLDEYDVIMAGALREHFRLPGMLETASRHFRDKLAMRVRAREAGIRVPAFVHTANRTRVEEFLRRVPPPWLLKPRAEAAAIGIRKAETFDEAISAWGELGEMQSFYLLEQFVRGDIYHVDSVVSGGEAAFVIPHRYGRPPLDVAQGGGVFTTRRLHKDSREARELTDLNQRLISTLGMVRGVTHSEFIRGESDDSWYFLETAARVGGAHIVDLIEAGTGVNLWREWARLEAGPSSYTLSADRDLYTGLVLTLAKVEYPDTGAYDDEEVVWRLLKAYHAGLIVASPDYARVGELLDSYSDRFRSDFTAIHPPMDLQRPVT